MSTVTARKGPPGTQEIKCGVWGWRRDHTPRLVAWLIVGLAGRCCCCRGTGVPGERARANGWPPEVHTRTLHHPKGPPSCVALIQFCAPPARFRSMVDGVDPILLQCGSKYLQNVEILAEETNQVLQNNPGLSKNVPVWMLAKYPFRLGKGCKLPSTRCNLLFGGHYHYKPSVADECLLGDKGASEITRRLVSDASFHHLSLTSLERRDSETELSEKEREGRINAELLETRASLSTGVIYESVARKLIVTTVQVLHKSLVMAMGTAFKLAGPPLLLMALWTVLFPKKNWDKAKHPDLKVDKPDDTEPKQIFKFREESVSEAQTNATLETGEGFRQGLLQKMKKRRHALNDWTVLFEFEFLEVCTQSFDAMMGDTLAARLNTELWDTLRQPLSASIARGAFTRLKPDLTKSISEGLEKLIPPRLEESSIALRMATKAITNSVVRSTSMATTLALSHPPIDDYYCYYCRTNELYCSKCMEAQLRFHWTYERADVYGSHYAQYYGSHYGERLSWHFNHEFFET